MLLREVREAARRLAKRPGYAALSVLVLGVGLGAVLFLFSLINTLILQPLPFPHADRLMAIGERTSDGSGIDALDSDQYLLLRGGFPAADAIGAYDESGVNLDEGHGAVYYPGSRISASMLTMLGTQPLLGRGFTTADEAPGADRVVLIGELMWRQAFSADPHVVGRHVRVDGQWATVIGVLPARFGFPRDTRVWLPLHLQPGQHDYLSGVVQLAANTGLGQASAELAAMHPMLQRALPADTDARALTLKPLAYSFVPENMRHWVNLMFGAGVLVLLLACVNVANLQLVQTLRRAHELALRHALGAGRGRLVLGALAEGWWLGAGALAVAVPIVQWGNRWVVSMYFSAGRNPTFHHFGLDRWVLAFGVVVAMTTAALAGAVPAWRAARSDPQHALRDGAKGSGSGFARVARVMVVLEIVLTVVLLVGAGTFVRALDQLLAQPTPGARYARNILTAELALPPQVYRDDARRIEFLRTTVARLQAMAGVIDATATDTVPGGRLGSHEYVGLPGQPRPAAGWPKVQLGVVGPHFLSTFGVRLLAGRFLDARDTADSLPVAVIDRKLADTLWPGQDPLQRVLTLHPGRPWARALQVVGVIEPLQLDSMLERSRPGMLMPFGQAATQSPLHAVGLAVRTHAPAATFMSPLAGTVRGVDSQVALHAILTQDQVVAQARTGLVVLTGVFGALGLVALLLAGAGLYGVLAYAVTQRTREIGIRRAIGAGHAAVVRMVGRTLLWQLGLGLAVGGALAWPWSNLLADPNLHTRGHDPLVLLTVVGLVVAIAVLSSVLPLLRALRVDPAVALRYE